MPTLDAVKNFAKITVSTGYDAVATSIVLSAGDGAKLPNPPTDNAFNVVWWNATDYADPSDDPNVEIVRCTTRSTDTLTVTRGQEGTTASTKNTAGKSYKMILSATKKMMDDIETALAAKEATANREAASGYAGLNASSLVIKNPASKGQASGIAELNASSLVVQNPASKGQASGLAELDAGSKVPTVQLGGAGADNTKYLRGDQSWAVPAGGVTVQDRDVISAEVVNTTVETTVYSYTVPANTLSTNKMLRLTLIFSYLNNSGAGNTFNFRVKFGATKFADIQIAPAANAARRCGVAEFQLVAANATNAQRGQGFAGWGPGVAGEADTAVGSWYVSGHHSLAIDSTLAQALIITFQHSVAATTISAILETAILELS